MIRMTVDNFLNQSIWLIIYQNTGHRKKEAVLQNCKSKKYEKLFEHDKLVILQYD